MNSNFESISQDKNKLIIVTFYASWHGQWLGFKTLLKSFSYGYTDIDFIKINTLNFKSIYFH